MPQCWACRRVQATAEVRKTPRGYKCKDSVGCKRWQTTMELPKPRKDV